MHDGQHIIINRVYPGTVAKIYLSDFDSFDSCILALERKGSRRGVPCSLTLLLRGCICFCICRVTSSAWLGMDRGGGGGRGGVESGVRNEGFVCETSALFFFFLLSVSCHMGWEIFGDGGRRLVVTRRLGRRALMSYLDWLLIGSGFD